jgi:predicted ABC-type ATPase
MPWMWIVAGPNGAGKSTFTGEFLRNLGMPPLRKLNADEVTAALRTKDLASDQNALNLTAAQIVDSQVEESIKNGVDFLVETVLSSDKYRDDLETAKAAGFKTGLIYVSLTPAELSPERVEERVQKGGHHVDRQTAINRYYKSHAQMAWFAARVDILMIYDNSAVNGEPILIASKTPGKPPVHVCPGANPEVDLALLAAFSVPPTK